MLACKHGEEHGNTRIWALNICIIRYITTIEGAYNINIYFIGTYNIGIP